MKFLVIKGAVCILGTCKVTHLDNCSKPFVFSDPLQLEQPCTNEVVS